MNRFCNQTCQIIAGIRSEFPLVWHAVLTVSRSEQLHVTRRTELQLGSAVQHLVTDGYNTSTVTDNSNTNGRMRINQAIASTTVFKSGTAQRMAGHQHADTERSYPLGSTVLATAHTLPWRCSGARCVSQHPTGRYRLGICLTYYKEAARSTSNLIWATQPTTYRL